MNDEDVFEVQRLYPQIYIACHTDHVRAVLKKLKPAERKAALNGLALLARAARRLNDKEDK